MTISNDDATQRHKAKMAKRKEVQDREVASKTIEKGLLIVHTGPGKGKSTAAFGLLLRALGHGWRSASCSSSRAPGARARRPPSTRFDDLVEWHTMGEGFTWETQDRERDIAAARRAWDKAKELMARPDIRMVVLDELNIALRYDYLPLDEVVAVLAARRAGPPRGRDGSQRQAGTDRGGRSRHRDEPGQAPLRRRREIPAGHRVLDAAR